MRGDLVGAGEGNSNYRGILCMGWKSSRRLLTPRHHRRPLPCFTESPVPLVLDPRFRSALLRRVPDPASIPLSFFFFN